jgi:hypothetical protein
MDIFDKTLPFFCVTIYVIMDEEYVEREEDGLRVLTKRGRRRIKKNIIKNLPWEIRKNIRPDIFVYSGANEAKETLDLFISLLARGADGKNIIAHRHLSCGNSKNTVEMPELWKKVERYMKKAGGFNRKWPEKVRACHWLKAGGFEAWDIKKNAEAVMFELARRLVSLPAADYEHTAVVASHPQVFNLLQKLNGNSLPPLGWGDIIGYRFMYLGKKLVSIEPSLLRAK